MEELLNYAKELGLNSIAEQTLEFENVHGIAVGIHPVWLRCWKIHLMYPGEDSTTFWERFISDFTYFRIRNGIIPKYYNFDEENEEGERLLIFDTVIPYMDLNWFPPFWKKVFGDSNIIVKIHLVPGTKKIDIKYVESTRLLIQQEYRPVAKLSNSAKNIVRPLMGGVSIGQELISVGTLGGIVIDKRTGEKYGLSCAHVLTNKQAVDQPAQYDNVSFLSNIGNCIFSAFTASLTKNKCQIYNTSQSIDMDVALVKIDDDIATEFKILNIDEIDGVTPKINLRSGTVAEINGRTSGYKKLVIADAIYIKQFNFNGEKYCFRNVIQLRSPGILNLLLHRPVSSGDSGAWVCVNGDTGTEWAAMVIGEDRFAGYAISSVDILEFLSAQGGYDLFVK